MRTTTLEELKKEGIVSEGVFLCNAYDTDKFSEIKMVDDYGVKNIYIPELESFINWETYGYGVDEWREEYNSKEGKKRINKAFKDITHHINK